MHFKDHPSSLAYVYTLIAGYGSGPITEVNACVLPSSRLSKRQVIGENL